MFILHFWQDVCEKTLSLSRQIINSKRVGSQGLKEIILNLQKWFGS